MDYFSSGVESSNRGDAKRDCALHRQTVQLWINGVLVKEVSVPENDLMHGHTTFFLAIGSYSPDRFDYYRGMWLGVIDDVRVYGRALSAGEIRSLCEEVK
ncbi:MAG TPA: LamG-like jellyroll fold domain-containing protein [Bacteroidota bacterium]|nr:LamG-like jellyroll fold domain-containing protein [Bacteroidota bacterium]